MSPHNNSPCYVFNKYQDDRDILYICVCNTKPGFQGNSKPNIVLPFITHIIQYMEKVSPNNIKEQLSIVLSDNPFMSNMPIFLK